MAEAAEEFWRFSLALYARPGVAPACLELQDRYGRDVILALYCCWVGASGRGALSPRDLEAAEATALPWRREVVERLRATRKALKGIAGAEALYGKMKGIELEAERGAHDRLAPLAPPADPAATADARLMAARGNLSHYLGSASAAAETILAGLAALVQEARPGCSAA